MTVANETILDAQVLNEAFAAAEPEKIVSWAATQFAPDLVMTSSFGAESALLIHMATRVIPDIKIVFINTGFLFPETHTFMEELRKRFNLNVWTYRTPNDPIAWLHKAGEENPQFRKDRDACCAANKIEPMNRAMQELRPRAWLRGIRRDQTDHRKATQFVEFAPRYGCHAISPLLKWSGREIYTYMKRHDLPYHPLYEQGYLSIGCSPLSCTSTVTDLANPRSGRWAASGKVECGINLTNSLDSAQI